MPKKNQSKSGKKVLPLNNQKKPLPKPDPTLIQVAHKVHKESVGIKGKKSVGIKGKESVGIKGKESVGIKGKKSVGIKGKESVGIKKHK
jgi:hypothetical protein